MAGERFAGYVIEGVLGRGGMGVVYRARRESGLVDRAVALKVIRPEFGCRSVRFRSSASATRLGALRHSSIRSIVPVYEADERDGAPFIAMRLVQGRDLHDLIQARGPLEPAAVVRLAEQVGAALDAAHAAGIVHRDVKPQNTSFDQRGPRVPHRLRPRARGGRHRRPDRRRERRRNARLPRPGVVPRDRVVDGRADQYALACTLFEAPCDRPASVQRRDSDVQLVLAHRLEPPPSRASLSGDAAVLDVPHWAAPWPRNQQTGTRPARRSRCSSPWRSRLPAPAWPRTEPTPAGVAAAPNSPPRPSRSPSAAAISTAVGLLRLLRDDDEARSRTGRANDGGPRPAVAKAASDDRQRRRPRRPQRSSRANPKRGVDRCHGVRPGLRLHGRSGGRDSPRKGRPRRTRRPGAVGGERRRSHPEPHRRRERRGDTNGRHQRGPHGTRVRRRQRLGRQRLRRPGVPCRRGDRRRRRGDPGGGRAWRHPGDGGRGVWVATSHRRRSSSRIDPANNTVVRSSTGSAGSRRRRRRGTRIGLGDHEPWGQTVVRVDPEDHEVERRIGLACSPAPERPRKPPSGVWVLHGADDALSFVDASTEQRDPHRGPTGPSDRDRRGRSRALPPHRAAGTRSLGLDAATCGVRSAVDRPGRDPLGLAATDDGARVWATLGGGRRAGAHARRRAPARGGTLRVQGRGGRAGRPDPQWHPALATIELDRCCLQRTLLQPGDFPRPDGGTIPRPDLAPDQPLRSSATTAAPTPSRFAAGCATRRRTTTWRSPPETSSGASSAPFAPRAARRLTRPVRRTTARDGGLVRGHRRRRRLRRRAASDTIAGLETPDDHTLVVRVAEELTGASCCSLVCPPAARRRSRRGRQTGTTPTTRRSRRPAARTCSLARTAPTRRRPGCPPSGFRAGKSLTLVRNPSCTPGKSIRSGPHTLIASRSRSPWVLRRRHEQAIERNLRAQRSRKIERGRARRAARPRLDARRPGGGRPLPQGPRRCATRP